MPSKEGTKRTVLSEQKSLAEDEYAGRDATGLIQPAGDDKTEAEARALYFTMYGKLLCLKAPALAWPLYFVANSALPALDAKMSFAHQMGLGRVFAA